ncbi:DUF3276 family protein [Treponema endosymbiont of Eucomonympha sp.]|uniref:DUF3276 family protein n=1 Tax=Treponema endosymbiont of Eucomonympha sp. TaxID=1580831 RepID=UPI00078135DD|nr:DUF3276 family protein [Treponema endosymbiont of Eucomonympha sp.]
MSVRGELFTTKVILDNRSYFFNVKENRMGDVFLQVVESKSMNGEDFNRRAIVVFADDMKQFFKGLDDSLSFIEKDRKAREKRVAEKKKPVAALPQKQRYIKKNQHDNMPKRTGKVHIVSKKTAD